MMERVVEEKELERFAARLERRRRGHRIAAAVTGLAAGIILGLAVSTWAVFPTDPKPHVERVVSRHLSFLEDARLLDEIEMIREIDGVAGDTPEPTEEDGA
jgi:hypothetical protein